MEVPLQYFRHQVICYTIFYGAITPTYERLTEHFWGFHFEMEFRLQNQTSISKSNSDFKIKLRFQNGASISKSRLDFKIELRFSNGAFI